MTNAEALQAVETEFAQRRAQRERERDERILQVREKDPAIAYQQERIPRIVSSGMRGIFAQREGSSAIVEQVKAEVADVQAQIAQRLIASGFAPNYMDMRHDCVKCKDTGYVGEHSQRRCTCFTQRMVALQFEYDHAPTERIFEAFDPSIYPSETQRAQAETAKNLCEQYANEYPKGAKRNLVLLGTSGLGKTFLLDCVAHRIIERGHVALSVTGFRMLEAMRAYHMGETQTGGPFEQLLSCPVLLIDDLGTEPMLRNISVEYLFTLLNERIASRKHTVVATNLTPAQLSERYGERVMSRLLDQSVAQVIRLVGADLRLRGHHGR